MVFLSELIKRQVVDATGTMVGKLTDVIVSSDKTYPKVEAICVRSPNKRNIEIPWEQVDALETPVKLKVEGQRINPYVAKEHEVHLVVDVLDRQVVDVDDRKLRRVNDLQLAPANGSYRLVGVDIGVTGLFRRLGLEKVAERIKIRPQENYIAWKDIDTVHSGPSSVKLKIPKYNLTKLHPADIAEIVDQLSVHESIALLNTFDEESAADTLEETSQERQLSVIEGIDVGRAADILEEMSPDDAADLLGDLPAERAEEILELMEPEDSEDVKKLLGYPEDTAGGIMTTEFVTMNEHMTARQALDELHIVAKDVETIYYLYILSDEGYLVGVMSLRELLLANPALELSVFMHKDVIKVDVMEDQREVAKKIAKYNLLALPVVEHDKKVKGIVTVDDAMDVILPRAWKKRIPKVFG
jgi:CBS domain-containing protein/sporulation protein YlmC with PRC-barrel domain